MKETFSSKLYNRELAGTPRNTYRKLYGDRKLIDSLDIVNELDGHSGCVNALSWSRSGNFLASGSDDQHLNVHKYQPDNENSQFKLTTTVATGHTANIFSVKFMPHSNDRTVVTAAGDCEVRVFDLEYAGQAREASRSSAMAYEGRRSRRSNNYDGVRYLNDGNTNSRVYRSHGNRVKRIVTESSPFHFLTCSEDGEVRQWDSRLPSSSYPAPRGGRFSNSGDDSLPPPLISYRRYQLDLNSISCSPSQPHYIALGGAHLHALLHDRRMTGRDRQQEAGRLLSPSSRMSQDEEQLMGEATRCVRKFAPKGQQKMRRMDNGHITALKISDARPNEMVASWSGDHIYSFDLVGATDSGQYGGDGRGLKSGSSRRVRESKERKRKRHVTGSQTSLSMAARPSSQPRTSESNDDGQNTALRVRYQNGQSEDIPLAMSTGPHTLTPQQENAQRIAKSTKNIAIRLFRKAKEDELPADQYTPVLSRAAAILTDIEQEIRDWAYPMDPTEDIVAYQRTLRETRERVRRFVQAAGTIARMLGGKLQTPSGNSPLLASFHNIETWNNDLQLSRKEQFAYDFVKAIVLWLDSGLGSLLEGFTRPDGMLSTAKAARRLPVPASESSIEAVDDYLIPYLLALADEEAPVLKLEVNRFEVDENRRLFRSEKAAVLAFAAAIRIPFQDLSSAVILAEGERYIQAQDRRTALRFWGEKVTRSILDGATKGPSLRYEATQEAFGGLRQVVRQGSTTEAGTDPVTEDDEEQPGIEAVEMLDQNDTIVDGATAENVVVAAGETRDAERAATATGSEEDPQTGSVLMTDDEPYMEAIIEDDDADDDDFDDNDDDDQDMDDEPDSDDEEDGVPNTGIPRMMYASVNARRQQRDKVAADVPCSPAIRTYRGHCNVKTVKDVNYFGLDDEYVVSGSDDGNFFIWDRKTGELLNVLEGDGEVVNVIQGHPYEPMLAVSGIDHTIKIFSPDARAREAARLGRGITAADSTDFSSIAWPPRARMGRRRVSRRSDTSNNGSTSEPAMATTATLDEADDEDYVAPNGLSSRRRMHMSYQIMNQNDAQRQGGNQDAFITRSMLEQLARRVRAHRATQAGETVTRDEDGDEDEAERPRLILGEDCRAQ